MVKVVKVFTKKKIGFALNERANPYPVLQYLPRGVTAGSQHKGQSPSKTHSILGSWVAAGSNIHGRW